MYASVFCIHKTETMSVKMETLYCLRQDSHVEVYRSCQKENRDYVLYQWNQEHARKPSVLATASEWRLFMVDSPSKAAFSDENIKVIGLACSEYQKYCV